MSLGMASRYAGQLPAEVTGFVGREAELSQVAALLGTTRLVTVTGPGGVGKTRVALRAAARAAGRFPDGVFVAELSALRDGELLADTAATALGLLAPGAGEAGTEAVLRHLRDRRALLILDTCEHLVDACAMLAKAIVTGTPGITLLATSRQPLDVPGEAVCPLHPLAVPAPGLEISRASGYPGAPGGSGDAVELFAQRAAAVVPGFQVTPANRDDVIALCKRLDGIPLAIELAAIRLRALPLAELAQRLDGRLQVVTGSRRGALLRHQTLRDAIGWSYELCSPAERSVWARLSVFADAFDIDAVEEVCARGDLARDEIAAAVTRLVDKSVLTRAAAAPSGARYRLLHTIREYGAEQLAATGDEAGLQDRHVARYLRMARHFSEHFLEDQLAQFRRLSAEHANIRAALEYALDRPDASPGRQRDGVALAISLWGYWLVSGLLPEGRRWLAKVLDTVPGRCPERAWALMLLGYLGAFQGRRDEAVEEAAEGTRLAAEIGDELAVARGHLYHMTALTFAGRHAEAATAEAQAQPRLAALGDRVGIHLLDAQAGRLSMLRGDAERSLARADEGLRRLGDAREHWLSSSLHAITGMSLFQMPGQEAAATAATGDALRAKHEIGDALGTACSLEVLAWLAAREGTFQRTAWLLGAADPLWVAIGGRLMGAQVLEEQHAAAEATARKALGAQRYGALQAVAARSPLSTIVSQAIEGAADLPPSPVRGPGAAGLTTREREIAGLVASGLSNREIAQRMVISKRTVDAHVEHIFGKLGISSRIQLTDWMHAGSLLARAAIHQAALSLRRA